jgi:hypothetical protein
MGQSFIFVLFSSIKNKGFDSQFEEWGWQA